MIITMAKIALLYGGRSSEHEVSCCSAASALRNLQPNHKPLLIGIDRDGGWYFQNTPSQIPRALEVKIDAARQILVKPGSGFTLPTGQELPVDVVIPLLHGKFGEDGIVQGVLETARLPYAGSGVLASAIGMCKETTKRIWRNAGLPVIPWETLHKNASKQGIDELKTNLFTKLGSRLFVKPAASGSSLGVSLVANPPQLETALENAWKYDEKALVEKAIQGRELECSVSGYMHPKSYPPGEIIPTNQHGFYDYDSKYIDPDGATLMVPAKLDAVMTRRIKEIAILAFEAIGAGGLARVDFLLEEKGSTLYLNEINTMPGLTPISLFPRMLEKGGVDFTSALEKLIDGALAEHVRKEVLL
ncbi:hypothetical protein JY97_11205 [Alkalispirochaeta odontotermitis]|nr:hypothetical protein JY97_11205 [Alkalispirochaeta odontotermitis]